MRSTKEKAANAAASAKAGMEKTRATMQEKFDKMMTTGDPMEKETATRKKEEGFQEAERQKQEAREQNTDTRRSATGGGAFGQDYSPGPTSSNVASPLTTPLVAITRLLAAQSVQVVGGIYGADREGTNRDGSDLVEAKDPNAAGGARTGYGSGSTV
ncbi:hypothetical protein CDL12_29316 [Handroanthus impetiginosus]|uniref:Uncharacterized protein n=1 Tax=Handroanthus impetiginosus TaxID=429701 RepID=A0A2G9FYR6_9LAMI|nr:hypothetical protein CDL12_29316 [Handroanthus impetiginosus]